MQHAIPYSIYQAYYNILLKKVDKAKAIYLKNKIQAYSYNTRSTRKLTKSILGKKNSHDLSKKKKKTERYSYHPRLPIF